jgi:hypothetical protein
LPGRSRTGSAKENKKEKNKRRLSLSLAGRAAATSMLAGGGA